MSATSTSQKRRRSDVLEGIPPASAVRQRLGEALKEVSQLRLLLKTAERIEASEAAARVNSPESGPEISCG